jgi:hypothetical protein
MASSRSKRPADRDQFARWLLDTWPEAHNTSRLSRLELVCGWVAGTDRRAPDIADIADIAAHGDPASALEAALLPALGHGPCCVAFSGGRDSSVLLAAATRAARRERLPDPIALTMRWGMIEESAESEWQEEIVRHLGLADWQIVEPDADMDLLGAVASSTIREHGLLWPPAAHGILPLLRVAAGGTLVSGDGGDQIFAGWRRAPLGDLYSGRRRPSWRDVPRSALAAGPVRVRAAVEARRAVLPAPWLSDEAMRVWRAHHGRALGEEPATWPAFLRWTRRERATVLMLETWNRLAAGVGADFSTPFWDPVFMRSLGLWGGRFGRGLRTPLMRALFSHLLPDAALRRASKARFTRVYFGASTRAFAESWSGPVPLGGVVDRDALRAAWLADFPPTTSAPLLQAAWRAEQQGVSYR